MKRLALIAAVAGAIVPHPVVADPGHERPRITVMRWQDPPVTAEDPNCQDTCEQEVLIVKAHDPDSSITEIQVWFSENDDAGPITFAHTYCLQGRAAGEPARMEIPGSYSRPGTFTVAAVAYSHKRCSGHERGDRHPELHSRVKRLVTEVQPAP